MSCPVSGGLELFLIGKNFLKDTKIVFQSENNGQGFWKGTVLPDKEFLQQVRGK
jgi:nuclear factor of activated T-cells 5